MKPESSYVIMNLLFPVSTQMGGVIFKQVLCPEVKKRVVVDYVRRWAFLPCIFSWIIVSL